MEARVASPWDDFWPKFWLTVIDKAVLGLAVAVLGYWFQKRLELFKRDQSLASELAKARLAAYHRVFVAVSSLDHANNRMWWALKLRREAVANEKQEADATAVKCIRTFTDKSEALHAVVEAERVLIGNDFARAAKKYAQEVNSTLGAAAEASKGQDVPDDAEHARRRRERRHLLDALVLCLPPFARAPEKDAHFSVPDFDTVYAQVTARAMQGNWK